ncbi:glycoside hydrolase superfamily [Sporodiniella umbellata]|nr:glycoside hydrolase superfamily [Sporodiniella umbellata]
MVLWPFLLFAIVISSSALPTDKKGGSTYNYWNTKAFGANLGNWLILERWLDPSLFEKHAPKAQDEWEFCKQATNASKVLKNHWDSWVTEDDFKTLARVKANHVRIPVGYWAFIKPDMNEPYVINGQKKQIERILGYCKKYGLYAIIDLHGLPGSQNGEAHSGHIGPVEFYSPYNINRGLKTVKAVLDWINNLDNSLKSRIASVETANEPKTNEAQLKVLKDYYLRAYKLFQTSRFKMPMIFHDSFKGLEVWKNFLPAPANAVIDLHPYYAFPANKDRNSIIRSICGTRSETALFHLPVLFGEWSLASGVANDPLWLKTMMDTQISVYQKSGAGGTFWNIKNKINSSVWSFELLVDQGIINNTTLSEHRYSQC